jgi:hypothetical protein
MKNLFVIITLFALSILLFAPQSNAQSIDRFSYTSFLWTNIGVAVDSNTAVSNDEFTLAEYDADGTTMKIYYGLKYTSVSGMPRIKTTFQGAFNPDSSWTAVDTLGVDTLETFQKGAISISGSVMYPYWRLTHTGATGNRDDAEVSEAYIYAIKKD